MIRSETDLETATARLNFLPLFTFKTKSPIQAGVVEVAANGAVAVAVVAVADVVVAAVASDTLCFNLLCVKLLKGAKSFTPATNSQTEIELC